MSRPFWFRRAILLLTKTIDGGVFINFSNPAEDILLLYHADIEVRFVFEVKIVIRLPLF